MFAVMAVSRPETWQKAGEEILREVYRLRDELVGPEELAKAKKQKAAELVFGRQTVKQAADSLGRNFLATGDPLFDKAYVEGIQKVTAEQVRDVARRYFVPRAAQPRDHRPAGRRAEVGRQKAAEGGRGRNPLRTAAQRAARAAEARTASCRWSISRRSCWAARWSTTRRRPAAPAWWARCSTWARPTTRPSRSPSTSIRSAGSWR